MKKEIVLKSLKLSYFRGLERKEIAFDNHHTNIMGRNGAGKTTLVDAWNWLLFGKDSNGNSQFEVKTLDKDNNYISGVEHEVTGTLVVDGETIELKRILKENWSRPKGQEQKVFKGNVTDFYWNDVPMKLKDYTAKVQNILDENVFKLITNPLAFDALPWKERRAVLIEMCGNVSDQELAKSNPKYESLVKVLSNKTLDEYKKEVSARRLKLSKDREAIPTRIDEVRRNMPEDRDFDVIREKIKFKQEELSEIEEKITDKSKAQDSLYEARNKKTNEIHKLKTELQNLEFSIKREVNSSQTQDSSKLDELERKIKAKKEAISDYEAAVKRFDNQIQDLEKQRTAKREDFFAENKKNFQFNEGESKCPTCKRAFEAEDIEAKKSELEANFNSTKQQKLNDINKAGGELKAQSEKFQEQKTKGEQEIKTTKEELTVLEEAHKKEENRLDAEVPTKSVDELVKEALETNKDYQAKKAEIKKLEDSLEEVKPVDVSEFQKQKQVVSNAIDELKKELAAEDSRKEALKRVSELEEEERKLSDQVMEIEGQEFNIESFVKLKVETLEQKINSQFKLVNFKLFNVQINGSINETCEALINGVPFSAANTASKINAGIDIINSLSEYYKVSAPIWLDGRESVTDIIDTDSQVINLIVSPSDKELRIA